MGSRGVYIGEPGQVVSEDVHCFGVCDCRVNCITKVVHEGVTPPAEAVLDVCVRQSLSMEKVACRDTDGMSRPAIEVFIAGLQLEDGHCCLSQKKCDLFRCDEEAHPFVLICCTKVNPKWLGRG